MATGAGGSESVPAGAELRLRSGATNFEGKGDVSARAAAFLEGVEPHIEVVDAKAAATEAIAPPLIAPLPGVVGARNARCTGVEELTERHRHARTALAAVGER